MDAVPIRRSPARRGPARRGRHELHPGGAPVQGRRWLASPSSAGSTCGRTSATAARRSGPRSTFSRHYWSRPEDWPWDAHVGVPSPNPMWEIAYQHWQDPAWPPIFAADRPFGGGRPLGDPLDHDDERDRGPVAGRSSRGGGPVRLQLDAGEDLEQRAKDQGDDHEDRDRHGEPSGAVHRPMIRPRRQMGPAAVRSGRRGIVLRVRDPR